MSRNSVTAAAAAVLTTALTIALAAPGAAAQDGAAEELADLRPAGLREQGVTPAAAAAGREWVARVQEAYGRPAFERHRTAEVVLRDDWHEAMREYMPWPENDQAMRFTHLLGTFTSRVDFLAGTSRGESWGLQQWVPYKRPPEGDLRWVDAGSEEGWGLTMSLASYQYFFELPFRLPEIPIVVDTGLDEVAGTSYRRLFATWETPEPHLGHDQYLLWVDPESGLIERLAFTLRDAAGFITSTCDYGSFRQVQGVTVPFSMVMGEDPETGIVGHRISVESVRFSDEVAQAEMIPDPARRGSKPVPGG